MVGVALRQRPVDRRDRRWAPARLGADVGGEITLPRWRHRRGRAAIAHRAATRPRRWPGDHRAAGAGCRWLCCTWSRAARRPHPARCPRHAYGESAIQDIVVRRFELAFNVFTGRCFSRTASMPRSIAVVYGYRYRDWLFALLVHSPLDGGAGRHGGLSWTARWPTNGSGRRRSCVPRRLHSPPRSRPWCDPWSAEQPERAPFPGGDAGQRRGACYDAGQ